MKSDKRAAAVAGLEEELWQAFELDMARQPNDKMRRVAASMFREMLEEIVATRH